jgi:hypothetical protein
MDVGVLLFEGWRVLKLGAYDISLLGGNIGEDVKEVGQGGDDGGWGQGAVGIDHYLGWGNSRCCEDYRDSPE